MDLPATRALCDRYGARLMVDEAHSIGSLGATGHGIEEHFDMYGSHRPEDGHAVEVDPERRRLPAPATTTSSTTSATCRGRSSSRRRCRRRRPPPRSRRSTSSRTSRGASRSCTRVQERYAAGLQGAGLGHDGLDDVRRAGARRRRDARRSTSRACCSTAASSSARSCIPPCPRGTDRLRTCLMATHTDEDIDQALAAFEEVGKDLGLI